MRTECPDRYRYAVHDKFSPKEIICFPRSIAYAINPCQEIVFVEYMFCATAIRPV